LYSDGAIRFKTGFILIKVSVSGAKRTEDACFALDTGATTTVINRSLLEKSAMPVRISVTPF
jgi:hypothetical protein